LATNNNEARLLTTTQAARYMNLHRSTIHRLIVAGAIPHIRTFKSFRIDKQDLDAFIESQKVVL
jgi:excisionase family DNA binding protein